MRLRHGPGRRLWVAFAAGQLGCLAYPFIVSHKVLGSVWYLALAALGVGMTALAVRRHHGEGRRVWAALGIGLLLFFLGDLVWTLDDLVWHINPFPSLADVAYVLGYPALAVGLAWLVRGRQPHGDRAALLDAAIVTTGVGILVGVEAILPALTDSTATLLGRVVSAAYPIGDLLLLAMVARLAVTAGRRLFAFWALAAGVAVVLVNDAAYMTMVINGTSASSSPWLDVGFAELYLLVGFAGLHHTAPLLFDASPRRDEQLSRVRLAFLGSAAVLAPGTLMLQVVLGKPLHPIFVGMGSIALFTLVLLRVAGLLRQVQTQSALLEVMARSDALTGLPNRGTWDHELVRVTDDARERGRQLTIALLDLDNFKRYNDTRGHIAGDRLLMELASVWRSHLAGRGFLARYGGEEFALAVPGMPLPEVEELVRSMCRLVPDGQNASAGIATWQPKERVGDLMLRVDSALYAAKRAGRNTVCLATTASGPADLVSHIGEVLEPRPVYQPIVDLMTGRIVAVEALSRFDTSVLAPDEVFARAWLRGHGPELEAAAIRAALLARPMFGRLPIHVNVSARGLTTPQIRDALPADLRSVVLEITEQDISSDWTESAGVLEELRRRGATLAIDDFGVGFSNLRRMIALRPEIVKIDRSIITGIEDDAASRAVVQSVAVQGRGTATMICAEGVETEAERRTLLSLGVPHGQGFLFSRPVPVAEAVRLLRLPSGLFPVAQTVLPTADGKPSPQIAVTPR